MSAPFFERPEWQAASGLHALIVGISDYANLPATADLLLPVHFGMIRLTSPALTAFRLAATLKARADQFQIPLATCRVLLAPSAAELAVERALAGFAAPDFVNFSAAAKAWRQDALADRFGMTLFYFAGHGLQRVKHDHVLVLQNFNDGIGGSLSNKAVNVDQLIDGMAASAGQESVARTQLYFFDTCRVQPDLFKEHEIVGAGSFWDVKSVPAVDDRAQPSFFASKPGGLSFAKPGRETLFGGALIKCLEGGAAMQADPADPENADWVVSLESLRRGLKRHIEIANRTEGGAQEAIAHKIDSDFVLFQLDRPPEVTVSLRIDPDAAAAIAKVSVVDADDQPLRDLIPFAPNPLETTVPGGVLRIRAIVEPENPNLRPRLRKLFVVTPPFETCTLGLAR